MYVFTNVFFGQRISSKLADQIPHVQQLVLPFADLESNGLAVHGEFGRRFDASCHGLQAERKFVAIVGFLIERCSQSVGKWTESVCRKDEIRNTGACLAAPNSTHPWYIRSGINLTLTYLV